MQPNMGVCGRMALALTSDMVETNQWIVTFHTCS